MKGPAPLPRGAGPENDRQEVAHAGSDYRVLRTGTTVSIEVLAWVMRHSEAKLSDRLVIFALADHAKADGTSSWPSVKTLSERTKLSERQVQRSLTALEDAGEILQTGTSRYGTKVFSLPFYISAMGGDNLSQGDREGVTSTTTGVTSTTGNVDQMSPDPSLEPLETRPEPTRARGAVALRTGGQVVALHGGVLERPSWKVDRVGVTEAEGGLARAVLATWNDLTGQKLTSKDWLAKIILRIREHPDLGLDSHEHVITAALRDPWWSGPASPSVVYGNGAQFERCVEHVRAGGATSSRPARFGRGLSARQIGEMFGEGGVA